MAKSKIKKSAKTKSTPASKSHSESSKSDMLSNLVYKELSKIPKGSVISYAELARRVGAPKSVRAIATIVGKNPNPITVPCHRVIRSNGELGEYSHKGKRDAAQKAVLLNSEGVTFAPKSTSKAQAKNAVKSGSKSQLKNMAKSVPKNAVDNWVLERALKDAIL